MALEQDLVLKKFSTDIEKLIINIMFTSSWLSVNHSRLFRKYNLTNEQYNVLRILRGQCPNACSLTLVAERMIEKSSNCSRIIDKLVTKKLVTRELSNYDKRIIDITITEQGLQLLTSIDIPLSDYQSSLNLLNKDEIEQVNTILDKFRNKQNNLKKDE